jgi:hypothetical protein
MRVPSNLRARKIIQRTKRVITNCEHKDRPHFAKGMCCYCYHKFGRQNPTTNCPHTEKRSYAKGMCQNCYVNDYNRKKRALGLATKERMPDYLKKRNRKK